MRNILSGDDGGRPAPRPSFGTVDLFEGRLYIQTGKVKSVSKQILANPRVELCGMTDGKWIRVQAEAVEDDRLEARAHMLTAYPMLKGMYAADDGNCQVFYLKNAVATICSFTSAPEDHSLLARESILARPRISSAGIADALNSIKAVVMDLTTTRRKLYTHSCDFWFSKPEQFGNAPLIWICFIKHDPPQRKNGLSKATIIRSDRMLMLPRFDQKRSFYLVILCAFYLSFSLSIGVIWAGDSLWYLSGSMRVSPLYPLILKLLRLLFSENA